MHAVADNSAWQAQIALRFVHRDGRTVLQACSHRGPLRVQRPFYPEGPDVCHTYLLHPPGGVVCSDRLDIHIQAGAGSHALLTTPGAGKFYRSTGGRVARQIQRLHIDEGASLEWLPQENIFFDGARCELATRIDLARDARFIGWEINCLGRPASNERFNRGCLRQRFELWRDGTPLWLERNRFDNETPALHAAWGLRGLPVSATLVCTPAKPDLLPELRRRIIPEPGDMFAVTCLEDLLVCRYLGHQAREARRCLMVTWRLLRLDTLGRPAVPPRIWNT